MKKYMNHKVMQVAISIMMSFVLMLCLAPVEAEAYAVTVQKDGIYAEVVPDSFVNNTAFIFKKYVKKAMKYYNKYKDADPYTYVSKVPEEYRDFIPVAKQIQDSDEIIIRNPFYVYDPWDKEGICEQYSFFAEKNGKKLCMFSIFITWDIKEVSFEYDKIEDSQFAYDTESVGETLFYEMGEITYAEVPDKISMVRDRKTYGGKEMIGVDESDWEIEQKAIYRKFKNKNYNEKKDEILAYLAEVKAGKVYKKAEKNLKSELEDESIELEKGAKKSDRTSVYIVVGIVAIGVITGGAILLKKRKRE